jgi:TetR/AcrR family transcriptional regulator, tetracycline repressor protein
VRSYGMGLPYGGRTMASTSPIRSTPPSTPPAARGRKGGRPRSLTRDQIVDAALEVVDTEGLEALTVRRLAEHLRVGQMTLYGYFRTKDEIVDALGARVLGDLATTIQGEGQWPDRLAEAFRGIRTAMLRHPAASAFLLSTQGTHGPELDRVRDVLIGVLLEAGLSPRRAVDAIAVLSSYVIGWASVESTHARRHPDHEQLDRIAHLDAAAYPHLAAVWDTWTRRTDESAFETGLLLLIDGLVPDGPEPEA